MMEEHKTHIEITDYDDYPPTAPDHLSEGARAYAYEMFCAVFCDTDDAYALTHPNTVGHGGDDSE